MITDELIQSQWNLSIIQNLPKWIKNYSNPIFKIYMKVLLLIYFGLIYLKLSVKIKPLLSI